MFWGWYSTGDGRVNRGGGCIFLPLLFVCGSFSLMGGFDIGWLLGLLLVGAVLWFAFSALFNRAGTAQVEDGSWGGAMFEGEKPKRDFADDYDGDEKPKRGFEYIERPDGEILAVIDPNEEDDRRFRDEF